MIKDDRPVIARYMSPEEAESLVSQYDESLDLYLRTHELGSKVRVVTIKGWIAIPCGGTHVKRTGEVGQIRLLKRASKGRGVVRIEFALEP